ncbi:hypothetical protein OGM84_04850 [Pediococcus acidilactici]
MAELEAAVVKLCFYEQPIFAVDNEDTEGKLQEYELLLREAGEDNKFPAALFKEYIRNNESNRIFCNWMANELKELVKISQTNILVLTLTRNNYCIQALS